MPETATFIKMDVDPGELAKVLAQGLPEYFAGYACTATSTEVIKGKTYGGKEVEYSITRDCGIRTWRQHPVRCDKHAAR